MECSTPSFDVNLDPNGFVVDLDSLYASLTTLHDKRRARGVRYALVTVLVYLVLAKLAGEDRLYGISQWVRYRKEPLAEVFHLKKPRAPCANTYRNILGQAIEVAEFERVMAEFFAAQPNAGQSLVITWTARRCGERFQQDKRVGNICWRRIYPPRGGCSFKSRSIAMRTKSWQRPRC